MAGKDEFEVRREATIPASRAAVYALLVDFHRWREWSPWEDLDPALSRTYSGPDAGTGAVYEWSGNRKAGAGRMEITDAVEPSKVQIALQFLKPFKSSSTTTFELVERDGATQRDLAHGRPQDVHDTRHGHLHEHGQDGGQGLREGP